MRIVPAFLAESDDGIPLRGRSAMLAELGG